MHAGLLNYPVKQKNILAKEQFYMNEVWTDANSYTFSIIRLAGLGWAAWIVKLILKNLYGIIWLQYYLK